MGGGGSALLVSVLPLLKLNNGSHIRRVHSSGVLRCKCYVIGVFVKACERIEPPKLHIGSSWKS